MGGLRDFAFEIGAAVVGAENDLYVRVDDNYVSKQFLIFFRPVLPIVCC